MDFRYLSLAGADMTGSSFENCCLSGTTIPDGFCSEMKTADFEDGKISLREQVWGKMD